MRMNNARQAIHDAFSIHATTPDRMEIGHGTKFDSTRAIFNGMKAGLIIRAVMAQETAHRGCALFLNAHDRVVNSSELYALKKRLWFEFLKKIKLDNNSQAEVMAIADALVLGYKARVWDHRTERHSVRACAAMVANSAKAKHRVEQNSNLFLDCLTKIDNESLQPVWDVINDQRVKRDEARDESANCGA